MPEPEFSKSSKPFQCIPGREFIVETDGKNEQHVGVINAWGGAILRGTDMVADGKEGIYGLMLSNAMHLSAFLDRPVTMPLDEELFYEELMKRVNTSRRKEHSEGMVIDLSDTYGGTR